MRAQLKNTAFSCQIAIFPVSLLYNLGTTKYFETMKIPSSLTSAWIALNSIKGLGPVRVNMLVKELGSPLALFESAGLNILKRSISSSGNAVPDDFSIIINNAEKQQETAHALSITILTLSDDSYPALLREIYAPPPVLYVKGNLACFSRHSIGVVGTRRPSTYGKNAAAALVKQLVENQVAVVSGLALGIDTISHQTCLDNKGITIAVLGCGLDKIYPATNKNLAAQILEQGAIVSEFELGTPPETFNFPRRNRIISGLSAGVLVVEAPAKSGSLITANYALQQGRDVFAIPGSIFSELSDGTFHLLKNGAIPVKSGLDIIENMQTITLSPRAQNSITFGCEITQNIAQDLLTETEIPVMDCLSADPLRIDTIAEKSGKSITALFDILLNLELKGLIRQVAGQQFVKA